MRIDEGGAGPNAAQPTGTDSGQDSEADGDWVGSRGGASFQGGKCSCDGAGWEESRIESLGGAGSEGDSSQDRIQDQQRDADGSLSGYRDWRAGQGSLHNSGSVHSV